MSQTKELDTSELHGIENRANASKSNTSTVTSSLEDSSCNAVFNHPFDSDTTMKIIEKQVLLTENCADLVDQTLSHASNDNSHMGNVNIGDEDAIDDDGVDSFVSFIIVSVIKQLDLSVQSGKESSSCCVKILDTGDINENTMQEFDQNLEESICKSSCATNENSEINVADDSNDSEKLKTNLMNALYLSPVPASRLNQADLLPKLENETKQCTVHFSSQIETVFEYDIVSQSESDNSTEILSPHNSDDDVQASQSTYSNCDNNNHEETDVTSLLNIDCSENNFNTDILILKNETPDTSNLPVNQLALAACTNNDDNTLEDTDLCYIKEDVSGAEEEKVHDTVCEIMTSIVEISDSDTEENILCPFIEINQPDEVLKNKNDSTDENYCEEKSKSDVQVNIEAINTLEDTGLVKSTLLCEDEQQNSSENINEEAVATLSDVQETKFVAIPLPVYDSIQYLIDNTLDKLDGKSDNTDLNVSPEINCETDLKRNEVISCLGNEIFQKETIVSEFDICEEKIAMEENSFKNEHTLEDTSNQTETNDRVYTSSNDEDNLNVSASRKRDLEIIPEEFNDNKRHKSLSCETNERKRQLSQDNAEGNIKVRKMHEVKLSKEHDLDIEGPKMLRQLSLEKLSSLDDEVVWENKTIDTNREEKSISQTALQSDDLQNKEEELKEVCNEQSLTEDSDSSDHAKNNESKEILSNDNVTETDNMVVPEMVSSDKVTGTDLNEEGEEKISGQTEQTVPQQNNNDDEVICSGKFITATEYLSQCSQSSGSSGFIFDPVAKFSDVWLSQTSDRNTNCLMVTNESKLENHVDREGERSLTSLEKNLNANTLVYEIDESDLTMEKVVKSKMSDNNINEDVGKDERKLVINDEDEQIDADFLDVYVDKAVDQMVPNFDNPRPKLYSCDADICDDEDISVCKPVIPPETSLKAGQQCFKWKYTPSCDQEMSTTELPDENQVVRITPLKTCGKPLRLGLSKRQPMKKSLHKIFRH